MSELGQPGAPHEGTGSSPGKVSLELQYIVHINFMSKLPVQSQAGWMSVRAGKARSKSIRESRVRTGREGNRDARSCKVAVKLHFPK